MNDMETLQAQAFIARNRVAELQEQLALSHKSLCDLTKRLTLTEHEKKVLQGHADGCVRVNELWPILRRVLGEAA